MTENIVENNNVVSGEQSQPVVSSNEGQAQASTSQLTNSSLSSEGASAESVQSEKTLTQSEVNDLVGRVKKDTAEKVRRELSNAPPPNFAAFNQQSPQMTGVSPQGANVTPEMQQAAQQALHNLAQQMWANQTASQFVQKIADAKQLHPDIEEKLQDLNLTQNVDLVAMANNVEKTAEVIYELANNPVKYANMLTLMRSSPKQAEKALREMSNAIRQNEEAKKQPLPDKPVSQLGHSTAGVGNGNTADAPISSIARGDWLSKYVK